MNHPCEARPRSTACYSKCCAFMSIYVLIALENVRFYGLNGPLSLYWLNTSGRPISDGSAESDQGIIERTSPTFWSNVLISGRPHLLTAGSQASIYQCFEQVIRDRAYVASLYSLDVSRNLSF